MVKIKCPCNVSHRSSGISIVSKIFSFRLKQTASATAFGSILLKKLCTSWKMLRSYFVRGTNSQHIKFEVKFLQCSALLLLLLPPPLSMCMAATYANAVVILFCPSSSFVISLRRFSCPFFVVRQKRNSVHVCEERNGRQHTGHETRK